MRRDYEEVRTKEESNLFKVVAWPVGKQPLTVCRSDIDGTLVLPSRFNSDEHLFKVSGLLRFGLC